MKNRNGLGEKLARLVATRSEAMSEDSRMMRGGLEQDEGSMPFDDEYRAKMASSHEHAVSLFEEVFRHSTDPELRTLAGRMLPTLQAHGSRLRPLRSDIGASRKVVE